MSYLAFPEHTSRPCEIGLRHGKAVLKRTYWFLYLERDRFVWSAVDFLWLFPDLRSKREVM
jgi:hypothetical protein